MTDKPISVTTENVPKPRLEDVTVVRFRAGTLDRIDAIAGKNRRAKWIRDLVQAELKRCEQLKRDQAGPGQAPFTRKASTRPGRGET